MRKSFQVVPLVGVILSLVAIFCMAPACVPAQDEETPDFSGKYTYVGTNPDGSKYEGQYVIEFKKTGDTYEIIWTKEGEEPSKGIGIVNDGKLCVGYDANGAPGVMIISRGSRGQLTDVWSFVGRDKIGTDIYTPVR